MGTKHPDRIHASDWRAHFETPAQMRRARWRVSSVCECCAIKLRTPLAAVLSCTAKVLAYGIASALPGGWLYRPRLLRWPPRCSGYIRLCAPG